MIKTLTIIFFILLFCLFDIQSQTTFRVMCYNVENLFDTTDNPQTSDEEFTPTGSRHWTPQRYYHKIQQIAKVITAAGEWNTPALIGLCEVENDSVLYHLLHRTPLRHQHYQYCITHGQDNRGINVALLYQRDQFQYLGHHEYPIRFMSALPKATRNILHVWGKIITGDRLDLFICHFPSRYGGEKESEAIRMDAAQTLRHLCDSIHILHPTPHILIMGDFNDTPENISIRTILNANPFPTSWPSGSYPITRPNVPIQKLPLQLYNLFSKKDKIGSHKYQGEWSQLDQFILSSTLCNGQSLIQVLPQTLQTFSPTFLLKEDNTWYGKRPFRSYYGFKYEGGYSDHLPIIVDFQLSE
ncbi:MAG: endonuclease [Parabacteroides sp.]|nr:endonuclease [Parabacteroides sp.]